MTTMMAACAKASSARERRARLSPVYECDGSELGFDGDEKPAFSWDNEPVTEKRESGFLRWCKRIKSRVSRKQHLPDVVQTEKRRRTAQEPNPKSMEESFQGKRNMEAEHFVEMEKRFKERSREEEYEYFAAMWKYREEKHIAKMKRDLERERMDCRRERLIWERKKLDQDIEGWERKKMSWERKDWDRERAWLTEQLAEERRRFDEWEKMWQDKKNEQPISSNDWTLSHKAWNLAAWGDDGRCAPSL